MTWYQIPAIFVLLFVSVSGHGYLKDPAMRGSMWRFPKKYPSMKKIVNEQDDSLDAGGPGIVRQNFPKRKFGMCGDLALNKMPRAHETGGEFGRFRDFGKHAIAACYSPGSNVAFKIEVTIAHGGYSLFELCVPEQGNDESENCFENGFKLQRSDSSGFKTNMPSSEGVVTAKYKLPNNVTCDGSDRCVLRWYWHAAQVESKSSIEYWNCADVQISDKCSKKGKTPLPSPTFSASASPVAVPTMTPTKSAAPPSAVPSASPSTKSSMRCSCNGGACPNGICKRCLYIGPKYGNKMKQDRLCLTDISPSQCVRAAIAVTNQSNIEFVCCSTD